jgi:hypothetical protein
MTCPSRLIPAAFVMTAASDKKISIIHDYITSTRIVPPPSEYRCFSKILLSKTLILFSSAFKMVHVSQPYNITRHVRVLCSKILISNFHHVLNIVL